MKGLRKYTLCSLVCLLLLTRLEPVTTFTMGAPDSACQAMTPGHGVSPQTSQAPATLRVSKSRLLPGQQISLTLTTNDNSTFKGFIIQARDSKIKDRQVGSFILSGEEASYMTCGRGIHNSITHRKGNIEKSTIQAKWMAPSDFEGDVIFRFSVVTGYRTFWTGMETENIRVSRSSAAQDNEEESTEIVPSAKTSDDTIKVVDKNEDSSKLLNNSGEIAKEDIIADDIPQPAQNAVIPKDNAEQQDKLREEEYSTPIYISSTTTLRTTTATTESQPRELPTATGLAFTDPNDPIFQGCNTTKACFGYPDGCVNQGKCELVLAYKPDKLDYVFEMKGLSNGYIAMGLSRDESMGEDLTTNCVITINGGVDILTGYNNGHSGNKIIQRGNKKDTKDGISDRLDFSRKDGWIKCSWKRKSSIEIAGESWDLGSDRFHVMLARGRVDEFGDMMIHESKIVSAAAKGLGEVGALQSKSRLFIYLHGAFMLGAWICSASLGIIMARYFKQTWTSHQCYNLDQWFIWHRNFMMLTWCLTMAGFILIILELRDISQTINTNPHVIIGFVTVGLCFLQPFLALVRCSPNHTMRPLFNWVHWLIGNVAQILAVVCIFYAVDLPKAELPRPETDWLLVAFVAFHFLTHLILSCINCNSDNNKLGYSSYPPTMRHLRGGSMFPDYEELTRDSPGSTIRLFVFVVYIIVNVIVSTALVLLVVLAPTRSKLEEIGILQSV